MVTVVVMPPCCVASKMCATLCPHHRDQYPSHLLASEPTSQWRGQLCWLSLQLGDLQVSWYHGGGKLSLSLWLSVIFCLVFLFINVLSCCHRSTSSLHQVCGDLWNNMERQTTQQTAQRENSRRGEKSTTHDTDRDVDVDGDENMVFRFRWM